MKKVWIIMLMVCILLVGITGLVMLLPGFQRRNDVFVSDFSLLEDGKALTVQIGVAGSMGYVRKLEPIGTKDNVLLLDAYSAFGGPNGSIGAKDAYAIPVAEDVSAVALCRSGGEYEIVLEKKDGIWQRAEAGNIVEK